jgi:hypothetical protein
MGNEMVRCPKCASERLSAERQGFSWGKAAAVTAVGRALAGPLAGIAAGLASGSIGKNKVILTCLDCGHQFKDRDGSWNT